MEIRKFNVAQEQLKNTDQPRVFRIRQMSKNKKANKSVIERTANYSNKEPITIHYEEEKAISPVYPEIDNDLARDNIENDMTAADLQDL